DAQALTTQLRSVLQSIDPGLAAFNIATLDARIDDSLGIRRAPLVLVGTFAAIALLLAAIGLYAVLAFVVGRRIGEIGLRIAIGAQQSDVMRLVFAQGARLLVVGLGLGLAIAVISGRIIAAQLFGVSALDPLTFGVVTLALSCAALFACFAPAWRASRVDPMVCLRSD
ncbi:MAG: FtsX-like permease family protein, partial [Proteobacteria bacterium]|nr:FtsX-like permease family protein [Burkholderiales bacterium]